MLQDEGKEILRRAAWYLQRRWLMEDSTHDGDYAAINLLRWMFTDASADKLELKVDFDADGHAVEGYEDVHIATLL